MSTSSKQHIITLHRKRRTRLHLAQNQNLPRLTVSRSLRHIYAQIIDDVQGKTLVSANDTSVKATGKKAEVATLVGKALAEAAKAQKITAVRFDRGAYKYHGRVAALAEGARQGGLKF